MSWNGTGLINGGQWDGASVIFSPTLTNNRPIVTPPSNITIEFANGGPGLAKSNATLQSWLATATAADFEDGALSVTADLSALPDPIQAGTYQIPFTATDSGGLDDTQTAQLIVAEAAAANPAPTSSGNYPQQSATVGVPFSFNGATTFSDPGDTLIYSATGLPSGLTINSNTGVVSGSASTAGGYTVVITATDSVGQQATAQLPIVVVASAAFSIPIKRVVEWDEDQTPLLVVGDTFWHLATLLEGVTPAFYNVSSASSIKVALISLDHTKALTDSVEINRSLSGANWSSGQLSLFIDNVTTAQAAAHISKETLAKIEIEVTIEGNTFTWFAPVRVVPGYVH